MKERPILFSGAMVRAILEGRKTQTRRVVKPVGNDEGFVILDHGIGGWPYRSDDGDSTTHTVKRDGNYYHYETPHACLYGQPGDRLWVRETWRIGAWDESRGAVAIDYKADGHCRREWIEIDYGDDGAEFDRYWTQSTDDAENAGLRLDENDKYNWEPGQSPCRWRPSIHMPRWASRITLEITGVRVERLQDISEDDAKAEGCFPEFECNPESFIGGSSIPESTYRIGYKHLWELINGFGSWALNQWVWVIEFRMVK